MNGSGIVQGWSAGVAWQWSQGVGGALTLPSLCLFNTDCPPPSSHHSLPRAHRFKRAFLTF